MHVVSLPCGGLAILTRKPDEHAFLGAGVGNHHDVLLARVAKCEVVVAGLFGRFEGY
jgi:hypothetical protein